MGRPATCACGSCTKCRHREYMRRWNAERPGYAAAMVRRRRAERPDEVQAYEKQRWETDLEYRRRKTARNTVLQAIHRGKLERGSCEACGAPNAEAHHDDYAKPFEIRWPCADHHIDTHHEFRRSA